MDKGYGKFGSYEWHENYINSLDDEESICRYVYQLRKQTLDAGDTIEETRDKAIKAMRSH